MAGASLALIHRIALINDSTLQKLSDRIYLHRCGYACVCECVCVCVFVCVYVCVKRSALYVSNVHTCEHSLHAVPPVCNDIHQFVTYFTCICDLVVEVPLMQAVPACSGIEYLSHPTQFSR